MVSSGNVTAQRAARGRWRLVASLSIGAVFVVFVEVYVGWAELLRPWRTLAPAALGAAVALMVLSHVTRALRVHDYFDGPVRGHRAACLQLVLRHNLLNNLLPMRAGEIAFPVLMQRRFGVSPAQSLPGLLWFRLLDLHVLVLLAAPLVATAVPVSVLGLVMVAWLCLPWLAWRGWHRIATRTAPSAGRLARFMARLHAGLPQDERVFWIALVWTLATWALKLAVFTWLLVAFAPLGLSHAVLGAIGGELTSVLPIHGAGGFGTYEAGVVAATLASGLDAPTLLRAAVNLHLFVLGVSLLTGLIALLPWPNARHVPRDRAAR